MILQEEFNRGGYSNLLDKENYSNSRHILEALFDLESKPEELLGIYISGKRDELFILLDGDSLDINTMCDDWDNRIRVFSMINGTSEEIQKLKFNIIQLVICDKREKIDSDREGNLSISRKMIIHGDLSNKYKIQIDDTNALELPFYMIPAENFTPDKAKTKELQQLLPNVENIQTLLELHNVKSRKTEKNGVFSKTFKSQEFDIIKGWIET